MSNPEKTAGIKSAGQQSQLFVQGKCLWEMIPSGPDRNPRMRIFGIPDGSVERGSKPPRTTTCGLSALSFACLESRWRSLSINIGGSTWAAFPWDLSPPQGGLHGFPAVGPIPPMGLHGSTWISSRGTYPPPFPWDRRGVGGVTAAPSPQTPLPKNSTSAEGGGAENLHSGRFWPG